jgi:hypothetical protein
MTRFFSPFRSFLTLAVVLGAMSGCSASSGPSYGELRAQAKAQRELLIEREALRLELAALVRGESEQLRDAGIATGPIAARKPFIGARLNDFR